MKTIYLDLDGVVADFDRYVIKRLGHSIDFYQHSAEGWEAIADFRDDMFLNLDPMPDAELLVTNVINIAKSAGFNYGVLTAIPRYGHIPLAEQHKREWLKKHFPELLTNFNIGPYAIDKQNHCKIGDVLIDDSELNIPQWISRGGFGILHTNAVDSLKKLTTHVLSLLKEPT